MENLDRADVEALGAGDERLLIERARWDSEAFARLYERYVDAVFRYLRTYAESEDDAADLTQHVFLRVLEALPRYQERGLPFRAWLFRIARNAATDTFRRRRRTLPWDHIPESLHPFSPGGDPETISLHREALNQLRVVVGQLPSEKQELLALRFAAGLSSAEIALVVGRSPAAVQKELVRIMHTVKEQVRDASI
ncbi:MAG TPA: RNA polymerase sigma factor [Chloroflexota bacterium]